MLASPRSEGIRLPSASKPGSTISIPGSPFTPRCTENIDVAGQHHAAHGHELAIGQFHAFDAGTLWRHPRLRAPAGPRP